MSRQGNNPDGQEPGLARRRFLTRAAAAGAGLAVMVQAPIAARAAGGPGNEGVQDILDIALTAERLATTFYYTGLTAPAVQRDPRASGSSADPHRVAPDGNPANVAFLQAALDQEHKHAQILANAGATSPYERFYFPAGAFDGLGFTNHVGTYLWVLDHLETAFIGAYIAAVRRFGALERPDLATVALRFLGVECQHRALYRAISRDDPADNITLEVAQFAHVGEAAVALTPFLTGHGFPGGATGARPLPTPVQVVRAVGVNASL